MALADDLATATRTVLDGLDDAQRADARLPFDEDERRTWVYWPAPRRGVPLWRLDRGQTKRIQRLLGTVLGLPAFARVTTIMGLDEVLDRLEGWHSDRRHRDDYWLSVFGEPGAKTWGVRFEGHHVSVHVTVADGEVRSTPLFLGANPAVVYDHGHTVVAPLALEERLGFDLLHGLTVEQRDAAVIADVAPDDIVTRNLPRLGGTDLGGGVPLDALAGDSHAAASALLDVYLSRFVDGSQRPDPTGATFAWAGAHEPGTGHYYRIAGPRLLVELDNTQDGANHVHTVVRDPHADFGDDVLAAHHRRDHRDAAGGGN
jgi:hypothetical protein